MAEPVRQESTSEQQFENMLKVWQIPIELDMDDQMEELQREYEQKLKEKEGSLNRKYRAEIEELHNAIQDL